MANNWTIHRKIDLSKPSRDMAFDAGYLYRNDNQAHVWEVEVTRDGAAASLSGYSARGYFIRPDGSTIAVAGSISGNVARVTLNNSCYAQRGVLKGALRLEKTGEVITISAMVARVDLASTENIVINTETEPDVTALLAELDEAIADAQEAASELSTAIEDKAVIYTGTQSLTDAQKATACGNIGAVALNQGVAQAGKALVIGNDGIVTLGEAGIPNAVAVALLDCFEHVAWADAHGQEYCNALRAALNVLPKEINLMLGNFTKVEIAKGAWGRSTETPTHNSGYETTSSTNRISANISVLDFEEGDVITVGDYNVYKFAIGTNRDATAYSGNAWINDGYQYEDYTLTAQDVLDMKVFFVTRVDGADMTPVDVEYISTHAGLKRTLTKNLARITAIYDGQSRVYSNTGLYELRPDLTVTAYYTDGTSEIVDAYTLAGTLHNRNSIITISYGGTVASVIVTVYELIADSTTFAIGSCKWYATVDDPDPIGNAEYQLNQDQINRMAANISVITFHAGDTICFDDYQTYKYAIGTNVLHTSPNNRAWIGGGYHTEDYTLLTEDIGDMKCMLVARIDDANMTDNDVAYLSAHMAVLRG